MTSSLTNNTESRLSESECELMHQSSTCGTLRQASVIMNMLTLAFTSATLFAYVPLYPRHVFLGLGLYSADILQCMRICTTYSCNIRNQQFMHHHHHHPKGGCCMYCSDSGTFAVLEITSRRWFCVSIRAIHVCLYVCMYVCMYVCL